LSAVRYLAAFLRGEIGVVNEETLSSDPETSTSIQDEAYSPRGFRKWPTKLDFKRRR